MLMNDMASSSAPDKSRSIGTKFGTTIGNRRPDTPASVPASNQYDLSAPSLEDVKANPYFDASLGNATAAPKERRTRELLFHQKGKFIAQAAALRRQAQLEDMKHRIAEQARKAGLAEDRSEQSFIVPEPPDVEWWDESLLVSRQVDGDDGEKVEKFAYPDITALDGSAVKAVVKIDVEDSVITSYVQHPVLLAAPQEKIPVVARGLYLTKKELKKKRRQQRLEILQEKQAKVRLGLEPPEPPKIKKSNLMRVLGEEAVKDPTAVEARVNRDIAERREKHETTNQENKLTAEQRHEKLAKNQEKDKAKGLMMCVFRIDSLAFGKHRYRVDVNAKQLNLTGMTILNPKLNLVIIEGGQWAINKYKKLMLQRIDWTENGFSTQQSSDAPNHNKHEAAAESTWLKPEDEDGRLKDLSENKCVLVWEGEEKQQAFKYWSNKVCETDSEARRALERNKMEYMWARAKDWTG
ncbi:hypothetical protein FH972_022937 [Carpinus fangiana]|uniref:Uncharacterized protein n=1 Tax=Carpinus fangiana TaxID=176857 RepID=A0A5N6KU09_9ROSI|nr:hypothetical protein FH972_022937 [Carpinus fangiana]